MANSMRSRWCHLDARGSSAARLRARGCDAPSPNHRQSDGERPAGFSPGVADPSRDPYGRCDRRWLVRRHRGSGQRPRFKRGRPCCRLRAGCVARAVSRCATRRHRTGPGACRSTRLTHGGRRCGDQQSRGGFVLLDQNPWRRARRPLWAQITAYDSRMETLDDQTRVAVD